MSRGWLSLKEEKEKTMRHFIIVKFTEETNPKELLAPVQALFDEAKEIPGVSDVKVHLCNTAYKNRYDMMIEMFMTEEGLEAYNVSEMHKAWKRDYGDRIAAKTIFDCAD